jgi:protein gp37
VADNSRISWTDATWNPLLGCTRVSAGCSGCYAITTARIRENHPNPKVAEPYAGLVHRDDTGKLDWTGRVNLLPDRLDLPFKWRNPRRIFVNSQSDLFHKAVPDEYIARVFAVMAGAQQHTFQLLTKQHGRMRSLLSSDAFAEQVLEWGRATMRARDSRPRVIEQVWPLPNVHLVVSVEDQKTANRRIPALLETPAAVRGISCEPLLGPVDLWGPVDKHGGRPKQTYWLDGRPHWVDDEGSNPRTSSLAIGPKIDWVVVGGESGPRARPMHPEWARTIRDQCQHSGVPFHFKQWGEWAPAPWKVERISGETDDAYKARAEAIGATHVHTHNPIEVDGETTYHLYEPDHKPWSVERVSLGSGWYAPIRRVGKKAAGRELDGRIWDEYPTGGQQ